MSVLVLIEHDNQNLKMSSLNTITAAKKINKSVHAIVLGEGCSNVADEVSKCKDIDEVLFQDVVASLYKRNQLSSLTNKISKNIFVPITVGGGIRNVNDIKEILINGADRVSINTAAVNDKKFIKESVKVFGSSTITITIESLKVGEKYKILN